MGIFAAQCAAPNLVPSLQSLAPARRLWTDDVGGLYDVAWVAAPQGIDAKTAADLKILASEWTTAALVKAFFDFYGGSVFDYTIESASIRLGRRSLRHQLCMDQASSQAGAQECQPVGQAIAGVEVDRQVRLSLED